MREEREEKKQGEGEHISGVIKRKIRWGVCTQKKEKEGQ